MSEILVKSGGRVKEREKRGKRERKRGKREGKRGKKERKEREKRGKANVFEINPVTVPLCPLRVPQGVLWD